MCRPCVLSRVGVPPAGCPVSGEAASFSDSVEVENGIHLEGEDVINEELQPKAFVVMPYGIKQDPSSRWRIDFDDIWHRAFRPAAEAAGDMPVRADEERLGGFVHLAMFERLLLDEVVLADLTLASPNVMYKLGIRHATRPRATLSIFAKVGQLTFDLSPIRAVPFRLDSSVRLTDEARDVLVCRAQEATSCRIA